LACFKDVFFQNILKNSIQVETTEFNAEDFEKICFSIISRLMGEKVFKIGEMSSRGYSSASQNCSR
jgi:hypothetical protein